MLLDGGSGHVHTMINPLTRFNNGNSDALILAFRGEVVIVED